MFENNNDKNALYSLEPFFYGYPNDSSLQKKKLWSRVIRTNISFFFFSFLSFIWFETLASMFWNKNYFFPFYVGPTNIPISFSSQSNYQFQHEWNLLWIREKLNWKSDSIIICNNYYSFYYWLISTNFPTKFNKKKYNIRIFITY